MNYKLGLAAVAVGACAFAGGVYAQGQDHASLEFSSNMSIVSDYLFRGISQSDENFAIQGGFDAAHESGVYAGIWASSVDFNDDDQANIEVDLYAGYGFEVSGVAADVGVIHYAYPGANDNKNYDFTEVYASLGYDFGSFSTTVGVNYSPEYFGDSGDALYSYLDVAVPLDEKWTLSGGVGYQTIDDNAAWGTPDYTNWNVTLGYDLGGANVFVAYHDTDLNEPAECADGCDARVVVGLSTDFSI